MKNKYAIFPLTCGALAFLGFLKVFIALWDFIEPPWICGLFLMIPALLLWCIAAKAYRGEYNCRKTCIRTGILLPILLIISLIYTLFLSFIGASNVIYDVKYYQRVYTKVCEEYDVKAVFPSQIPSEAKNVEFLYCPLLLQQGEVFELSYTTTHEEIISWTQRLEKEAQWIGSNEQWCKTFGYGRDIERDCYTRYHLYWDGKSRGEMSYVLIEPISGRIVFHWSFGA